MAKKLLRADFLAELLQEVRGAVRLAVVWLIEVKLSTFKCQSPTSSFHENSRFTETRPNTHAALPLT